MPIITEALDVRTDLIVQPRGAPWSQRFCLVPRILDPLLLGGPDQKAPPLCPRHGQAREVNFPMLRRSRTPEARLSLSPLIGESPMSTSRPLLAQPALRPHEEQTTATGAHAHVPRPDHHPARTAGWPFLLWPLVPSLLVPWLLVLSGEGILLNEETQTLCTRKTLNRAPRRSTGSQAHSIPKPKVFTWTNLSSHGGATPRMFSKGTFPSFLSVAGQFRLFPGAVPEAHCS